MFDLWVIYFGGKLILAVDEPQWRVASYAVAILYILIKQKVVTFEPVRTNINIGE